MRSVYSTFGTRSSRSKAVGIAGTTYVTSASSKVLRAVVRSIV